MRKLYRLELKELELKEAEDIKRKYRQEALKEDKVCEEAIELLIESSIAEDPKERKKLSNYSKKKQYAIAKNIINGKAGSVKEGYELTKKAKSVEITTVDTEFVDITNTVFYEEIKGNLQESLFDISSNEINLAIVECPLKLDWAKKNLHGVAKEVYEILEPGGYAIFILGHKSLMYAADLLEPLEPLHTLCIRKTPGNSSFIPGANIIGASVVAALCYKPPFKSPRALVPDLITVGQDENEVIDNINEVESGIEKAFDRYIESLLDPTGKVIHIICQNGSDSKLGPI